MKWSSLLKDIKEKVGLSSSPSPSSLSPAGAVVAAAAAAAGADSASPGRNGSVVEAQPHTRFSLSLSLSDVCVCVREKETALNMAVDIFCRLVRQQMSVAQLVTTLVEAHIFSFVVGRAFVTDVEKLRIHSKSKSLHATKVMSFFSEVTEDGLKPGSNLLFAVEVLVTGVRTFRSIVLMVSPCVFYWLSSLMCPGSASTA
ncbi:hypothetical protein Taro_012521 [Colocasia esculenta]|uniref:Uncharacterized protein n=1 Tax=Colocasia esculenta TaxID=4460 RepID=A0A843UDR5_COLES|nr:hypothetical protein [Colocasia esculenta]